MNRYPGIRPFRTDEQNVFFGRDDDIERLYRLIRLEQIVILYGKSGYGKSSLLQAGIFPKLDAEGRYQFWAVRFGPYQPERIVSPAQNVQLSVEIKIPGEHWADVQTDSIWEALKSRQTAENKRFILFFDQFEELFTYPPEQIAAFKQQLAEALYADLPERLRNTDYADTDPFELKVVFAIRSDRMSQLNALKDYLPNLLQYAYELDALDEKQAAAAVVRPAGLTSVFSTPPFTYTPAALQAIFSALRDERGRIETSTLQIVCRHVENNLVQGENFTVTPEALGDIKGIFRNFYDATLAELPEAERPAARRLVEDVLIKDGARLPFAEQALLAEPGVTRDLLKKLADASLLRVERDDQGRMLYEVGHDTLVAPIVEAATARREKEEKERLRRETAEAKRREAEAERKRRRALLLATGAIALAIVAVVATIVAVINVQKADESRRKMQAQIEETERERTRAESNEAAAIENAQLARDREQDALRNLEALERQKDATAEQKRRAEEFFRLARQERIDAEQTTTGIVQNLIEDADRKIYRLDHDNAVTSINAAYDLVVDRDDDSPLANYRDVVADALLEMAFYYTYTGRYTNARWQLEAAGKLYGQSFPGAADIVTNDQPGNRDKLDRALRGFRPWRYRELETRYFPDIVGLPGGEFWMGRDTTREPQGKPNELPRHRVGLDRFGIARTETTMWQYGLFCAATGRDIGAFHDEAWGEMRGNDPVIAVSWYDAALYANWLSEQAGLTQAYIFADTAGNDQYDWRVTIDDRASGFRLPTEAEWEYAARGGVYHIYSGSDEIDEVAQYRKSRTQQVGGRKANGYGLVDMSGNLWELCQDWYAGDYYAICVASGVVSNPQGPHDGGDGRVLRGGSWYDLPFDCRASSRGNRNPGNRYGLVGFRVARSAGHL